jgi:hypothetical protein
MLTIMQSMIQWLREGARFSGFVALSIAVEA